jgi:uncharacterized membrane protein YfcA
VLEPEALVFALVVVFVAGATQSLTGFGFGLVAIPLLTLVISPKLAPPVVLICGIVLNLLILRRAYVAVQPKRIGMLTLAGILGVPFGTWVLANWGVESLRIYIGVMTCLAAAFFLAGFRREIQHEAIVSAPVGFVSGIMQGSINMAGPPVILFFTNQGLPRQVFRANIIAYFFVLQIVSVPLLILNGILDFEAFTSGVILLPSLIAGGFAGAAFADRVDDGVVRRITLVIVSFAGIVSILNGAGVI